MAKNYLRYPTDKGIKIVSFTEPPYVGFMEALREGETLVLCYHVPYQYGKESSQGGYYIRYEPIESQIKFDYLMGFYLKSKNSNRKVTEDNPYYRRRNKRLEKIDLSVPSSINPADIKGFYARNNWNANRTRYRQEAMFADAVDYGSSVKRPTEDVALAAVMHGIPVEDMIIEERDF